jgi:acyl carrier protein
LTLPDASQIYARLGDVLRDVFDDDGIEPTPGLDASQVDGWDSMGNVRLFLAIEQEFGVRFGAGEIGEIKNVAELVAAIQAKL